MTELRDHDGTLLRRTPDGDLVPEHEPAAAPAPPPGRCMDRDHPPARAARKEPVMRFVFLAASADEARAALGLLFDPEGHFEIDAGSLTSEQLDDGSHLVEGRAVLVRAPDTRNQWETATAIGNAINTVRSAADQMAADVAAARRLHEGTPHD